MWLHSSMFWHEELKLLLMVYVDDFKMAGNPKDLKVAWTEIMKKITFKEKPTRTTRCLGCNHIFGFKKLAAQRTNGQMC